MQFLNEIKGVYNPKQIILHEAYLCNEYYSKTGTIESFASEVVNWNNSINKKLEELYSEFKRFFPQCKTINLCSSYKGSENNKWGLASTHYQKEYYSRAADELIKLISEKPGFFSQFKKLLKKER